jgi:hypothetical protein
MPDDGPTQEASVEATGDLNICIRFLSPQLGSTGGKVQFVHRNFRQLLLLAPLNWHAGIHEPGIGDCCGSVSCFSLGDW